MYTEIYIGERIKTRRIKVGLTQKELAAKINDGIDPDSAPHTQISNWENGIKIPGTEALIRLCNALDCDIDYLLGAIDVPHRATHDVMEQTGLEEDAAEYLKSLKRRSEREGSGYMAFAAHELKALSFILEHNTIGGHNFLSTLYSLIFGDYNRISLSDKGKDGNMVTISALHAALISTESEELGSMVRVGDMQNIFLVNLQEFLLDLRDKALGKDRHNPPIKVEM